MSLPQQRKKKTSGNLEGGWQSVWVWQVAGSYGNQPLVVDGWLFWTSVQLSAEGKEKAHLQNIDNALCSHWLYTLVLSAHVQAHQWLKPTRLSTTYMFECFIAHLFLGLKVCAILHQAPYLIYSCSRGNQLGHESPHKDSALYSCYQNCLCFGTLLVKSTSFWHCVKPVTKCLPGFS